jgi:hypothetical protein
VKDTVGLAIQNNHITAFGRRGIALPFTALHGCTLAQNLVQRNFGGLTAYVSASK